MPAFQRLIYKEKQEENNEKSYDLELKKNIKNKPN